MKKTAAIILICALAFSQIGYYLYMRFTQEDLRKEMKARIRTLASEHDLVAIDLNDEISQIRWEEEGKEFSLSGEMYDVVKTKELGGRMILYCIKDKIEQGIINKYNDLTKNNSSAGKKGIVLPLISVYMDPHYAVLIFPCLAHNNVYRNYQNN